MQLSETASIKEQAFQNTDFHHILFCFLLCCMSGLNNEEYQIVIGNDTTSYIIDDLEPARNYSFYIVAYMPMGASRMSDQVSQHTLEDGKNRALRLPAFLALNHFGSWAKMNAGCVYGTNLERHVVDSTQ